MSDQMRTGLMGLSWFFVPYVVLPFVSLVTFLFMRGAAILRVLLLLCAIFDGVRFPP